MPDVVVKNQHRTRLHRRNDLVSEISVRGVTVGRSPEQVRTGNQRRRSHARINILRVVHRQHVFHVVWNPPVTIGQRRDHQAVLVPLLTPGSRMVPMTVAVRRHRVVMPQQTRQRTNHARVSVNLVERGDCQVDPVARICGQRLELVVNTRMKFRRKRRLDNVIAVNHKIGNLVIIQQVPGHATRQCRFASHQTAPSSPE